MSRAKTGKATYIGIPLAVAQSGAFKSLPAVYRALYLDLRRQFKGYNNGLIAATDTVLGPFGWSHSTIHKGLDLLIEHKLLERVRRGGLGQHGKKCSLYAFTDLSIEDDEKRGIHGRLPELAFQTWNPNHARRDGSKKPRSTACTVSVHGVDRIAAQQSTM